MIHQNVLEDACTLCVLITYLLGLLLMLCVSMMLTYSDVPLELYAFF